MSEFQKQLQQTLNSTGNHGLKRSGGEQNYVQAKKRCEVVLPPDTSTNKAILLNEGKVIVEVNLYDGVKCVDLRRVFATEEDSCIRTTKGIKMTVTIAASTNVLKFVFTGPTVEGVESGFQHYRLNASQYPQRMTATKREETNQYLKYVKVVLIVVFCILLLNKSTSVFLFTVNWL